MNTFLHRSWTGKRLCRCTPSVLALVQILIVLASHSIAYGQNTLDRIAVASDGSGFQKVTSHDRFTPWGFNYDHDEQGRLIEEYWDQEWKTIEDDFREMKTLGANVIRIHLQISAFLTSKDSVDPHALQQLDRLLELAEREGLYLDLTGLGCYHKQDVPAWYDALDEVNRWNAQAVFWEAVAKVGSKHHAVFCYDLMNEPVVPGGDAARTDWLGPDFAGKHFTQFIALSRDGRKRSDVARDWIQTLVAAIRSHDTEHLITVGLVPWSLDRPGLTSGFVPEHIASELDFIAVHVYPELGKRNESLELLKGFAVPGKPLLVEEVFPLRCNAKELGEFIQDAKGTAQGWIGFYWGTTLDEYRQGPQSIARAITREWLELFQQGPPQTDAFTNVAATSVLRNVSGIAAEYPLDRGLEGHGDVIFVEDFETDRFRDRWDEVRDEDGKVLQLNSNPNPKDDRFGMQSLQVTADLRSNTGGGMTKWFESNETIHIRWYVRFDPSCDYVHHFCTLRANRGLQGGDRWSGFGGAGLKPDGDTRFSTALEPWGNWGKFAPPGRWNFYSYWHEMKASPDGKYWGNSFIPDPAPEIPRGPWICCEMMLQHNTPGQADGEQAFWIDGELRGHWKNIHWRTNPTLWANAFTLESYVTDRWTHNPINIVFFDNVVIAKRYIGPISQSIPK